MTASGAWRPAAVLVAAMLIGCSAPPADPPEWVTDRRPLAPCGAEEITLDRGPNSAARECLLDAWREGRGAELISEHRTPAGDPVTRIIRVLEDGTVEIFVDLTDDRFAEGTWEQYTCESLRPVRPEDGLDESWVFVEC